MVAVRYDDIFLAFDFVSSAAPYENGAYVCLDSGKIYWTSALDTLDEELPEDVDSSDRYLPVPHKNELELGERLALRFAAEAMPQRYERVADIFRRKGAYRRFKDLLAADGRLDDWYRFEQEASERALREWCADNGLELVEGKPAPQ